MKILIDATWIGGMYGTRVMHGGYRVINEYLKRLGQFKQHQFFLTSTNYSPAAEKNLQVYASEVVGASNVGVRAKTIALLNYPWFRSAYSIVSRYVPVPYIYPFTSRSLIRSLDVFHAPADTIPGIIRRNRKVKKFFTALDLIPLVRPDLSNVFYDYTKLLYDSLTTDTNILAISECTKRDILKYRPDINPNKIRVIYLAADEKLFHFLPNKEEAQNNIASLGLKGKKYFLTVNSIARYKNVEFVVDCFVKYITDNDIQDLSLVVIGQNREVSYKEYIEKKYGNADKVIMLDYVGDDKLANLYSCAMGFLYMSKYEGFGLPILEAMQSGSPVICSNAASMPEVAGEAAILVDPSDDRAFIKAMDDVHLSESLREDLRLKGLQQASTFSWDKYAAEVVAAYEEM